MQNEFLAIDNINNFPNSLIFTIFAFSFENVSENNNLSTAIMTISSHRTSADGLTTKRHLLPTLLVFILFCLIAAPSAARSRSHKEPLFGKKYQKYQVRSNALKGAVFYLVSGHGGPDPGCIGKYQGKELHEDEYAYDIILRLGRRLLENGAKVHFIIQDEKDGIRDKYVLDNSKREKCMGKTIPLDQVARLHQRCNAVNKLYYKDKSKYKRAIFIHVDSRTKGNRIDLFAYHAPKSKYGKRLSDNIIRTFNNEYKRHQPNRGFDGTTSARNLYVLRNTYPVASFIEVGNIQNPFDQKRLVIPDNRQAMANWMTEAIIRDFKQGKRL